MNNELDFTKLSKLTESHIFLNFHSGLTKDGDFKIAK